MYAPFIYSFLMKSALFTLFALSLGCGIPSALGQEKFNPIPAVVDSPTADAKAAVERLFQGSEGKTPTLKNLDPAWVQSLGLRGQPTVYTKENSKDFSYIGIPVGGIGAGELYLSGDGKLWLWDIFNTRTTVGLAAEHRGAFTKPHTPEKQDEYTDVLAQGFVLQTTSGGKTAAHTLDKKGFADVEFRGQYPISYVDYSDPACPVQVGLEAFSPFVPGCIADSSLPATILNYTLTNTSSQLVDCVLGGWIENGACWKSRHQAQMQLTNAITKAPGYTALTCSASQVMTGINPPEVFDDFESGTYDKWTVTGTAFGSGPVKFGSVARSKRIYPDNQGQYYVDSRFNDKTGDKGALTGKPFVIKRPFITFLIGGGKDDEGINLLVDGTVARHVSGTSLGRLRPDSMDVHDLIGKTAQLQIADNSGGSYWSFTMVDDIRLTDTPVDLERNTDVGTMSFALLGDSQRSDGIADTGSKECSDAVLSSNPAASAQSPDTAKDPQLIGGLRHKFALKPGEKITLRYVVAWDFPNPTGVPLTPSNRAYSTHFKTSDAVVAYLAANFDRLAGATRLWHDTYYDSTLPYWFLDRSFLNVSTLATSTCFLLGDDLFYANEGGYSCFGTCTHVWSYQQALGFLFPELEKDLEEKVSLNQGDNGGMNIVGGIPPRQPGQFAVALDGQAGVIIRAYLVDRMSADHSFLARNYGQVKKATNYLIDNYDAEHNGIMEGKQHNTLDAAWYGKVAWLSLYYQAALRATAEMATTMNDADYATNLRTIADKGRRYIEQKLFDGDYFVEEPDPKHPDSPGSYKGCEIDQLIGQSWAYHVGLGQIIDPAKASIALNSIWKYNYTTDIAPYRKAYVPGRWFALAGEGGVMMGTFPKGIEGPAAVKGLGMYFNEVWAGSEHLLASLMMWQGMVDKGLAIERTINDRYNGARHNPWDEVECGSHYARSMSSYGVFTAACGFEYNGPEGLLAFAPRLTPEKFKAAFTAADGWGSFSQSYEGNSLSATVDLRYGKLRLKTLALVPPQGSQSASVTANPINDGGSLPNVGQRFAKRLQIFHGCAARDLAAGVHNEWIAGLLITTLDLLTDLPRSAAQYIGHGVQVPTDCDIGAECLADFAEADHVIDVDYIKSQRRQTGQQMGDVSANMHPYPGAHLLEPAHKPLLLWQD